MTSRPADLIALLRRRAYELNAAAAWGTDLDAHLMLRAAEALEKGEDGQSAMDRLARL